MAEENMSANFYGSAKMNGYSVSLYVTIHTVSPTIFYRSFYKKSIFLKHTRILLFLVENYTIRMDIIL